MLPPYPARVSGLIPMGSYRKENIPSYKNWKQAEAQILANWGTGASLPDWLPVSGKRHRISGLVGVGLNAFQPQPFGSDQTVSDDQRNRRPRRSYKSMVANTSLFIVLVMPHLDRERKGYGRGDPKCQNG